MSCEDDTFERAIQKMIHWSEADPQRALIYGLIATNVQLTELIKLLKEKNG